MEHRTEENAAVERQTPTLEKSKKSKSSKSKKKKKKKLSSSKSNVLSAAGDNASLKDLEDQKDQYRQRSGSPSVSGGNGGPSSPTALQDAKAQYRRQNNRGTHSPMPSQQQQQQQVTQPVHPANHDRVGAFRINMTTADVTRLPHAENNNGHSQTDEYDQGDRRGAERRVKNKETHKPKTNFQVIVGTLIALIVVLLIIILVTVFLVGAADEGSGSSKSNSNEKDESTTLEPGTMACQEDVTCQDRTEHIQAWEASGCIGVIDCEIDFASEDFGSNQTLRTACVSLQVGTQECHDNIICKRRKRHVQFVVAGLFDHSTGNSNFCETTSAANATGLP